MAEPDDDDAIGNRITLIGSPTALRQMFADLDTTPLKTSTMRRRVRTEIVPHEGSVVMIENATISGGVNTVSIVRSSHVSTSIAPIGELSNAALAAELEALRVAMRARASDVEHDEALVAIGRARQAAENGDSSAMAGWLKAAGDWARDIAVDQGLTLVSDFFKTLL